MEQKNHKISVVYTTKHYTFAVFVFVLWSYLVLRRDHILGCPYSHGIMYHTGLHLITLNAYMLSHAIVIHQVERINKPYEFAVSKMGNILLTLRRLKFFLTARIVIICVWLLMVFYLNAEETYIPVLLLIVHLLLVIFTIKTIINAVEKDSSKLNAKDKMKLRKPFYIASTVEVFCSILWLMFNIADVHYCHDWYKWKVNW